MARAKAGSGFLLQRGQPETRFVLTCSKCGEAFEQAERTVGEVQRDHYMRMHDVAKITFTLLDRWSGRTRVLN